MKSGKRKGMTRREFIRDGSAAALGGSLLLGGGRPAFGVSKERPAEGQDDARGTSEVVLVRNPDVLDADGVARHDVTLEMLDAAVTRLTGEGDATAAWARLIRPEDVVGIKTNVWSPIGTPDAVEDGLLLRVREAGVDERDVDIADRTVLAKPFFKRTTALVNARPLRSHHWSGVGGLIKNYIMFVPDPPNYHEDACSRLAEIWTYPIVKDKTRLNVLVMLTPQFHNVGPHGFSPKHVWNYHGLLAGFDPVAVDTIGVKILQAIRNEHFGEERPLSPSPKHIAAADTRWGIGTSDPERIELVKLGYDERSFI